MAWGHQHFCSFPAPSHTSLSCSCSAESVETTRVPTWTAVSKATCLENLNAESLTRAWSPSGELRNPGRLWLSPRSIAAQDSQDFQFSHRTVRGLTANATLQPLQKLGINPGTSWVLLNQITLLPCYFGNGEEGELSGFFFLAENLTPKCSSHTNLQCNLLWSRHSHYPGVPCFSPLSV